MSESAMTKRRNGEVVDALTESLTHLHYVRAMSAIQGNEILTNRIESIIKEIEYILHGIKS